MKLILNENWSNFLYTYSDNGHNKGYKWKQSNKYVKLIEQIYTTCVYNDWPLSNTLDVFQFP